MKISDNTIHGKILMWLLIILLVVPFILGNIIYFISKLLRVISYIILFKISLAKRELKGLFNIISFRELFL